MLGYPQNMPFSLAFPVHHELIVKKSRFIACVEPVTGREEALARVAQLKKEYPDATHVCWALLAGGQSAAHDDGEPSGTAGRPMLEVLRHQDLQGVLASVVRYFGGVKLGTGGLVRAYTDAVAQALLKSDKVPLVHKILQSCRVPYAMEGMVRRELTQSQGDLRSVAHDSEVTLTWEITDMAGAILTERLNETGMGKLVWLDPTDGRHG